MCTTMNCQRKIELDVLSEQDSWNLFKHNSGGVIESPTLNDVAKKVVAECGGLPLALVTVGSALKNEDRLQEWKQASDELRISLPTSIHDMEPRVYASLRLSYNRLPSEEAKQMFLLCCLFPKDYDIDMETLVLYGVGIRLFQGVIRNTMEEARNRARAVINSIKASSLLLESYIRDHIKVHDLVRDVGILISSTDNTSMVRASVGLDRWPTWERSEHCTSISLMFNDIEVLNDELSCPNLRILLLQHNKRLSEISDAFFEEMESLEVLDLSYTKISALPSSIKQLTKLRTVRARYVQNLLDISIFGELNDLEMLDLRGSHLSQFPKTETGQSRNLRVLNLEYCSFADDSMLCDFISSLTKLEELYILGKYWSDKAKNIVWKSLPDLTTLWIETKNVEELPEELCKRLRRFFIIEWSDLYACDPGADTCLNLSGNHCFMGVIKMLLEKTRHLRLNESRFSRNDLLELIDLPNLEILKIQSLNGLREICHGLQPHTRCSWKLSSLTVESCHGLFTVVPFNLLTKLLKLESLTVYECERVEAIFDLNHEGDGFLCLLSTLTELELGGLPNLKKIWKGPTRIVCLRNLKRIKVTLCDKLGEIFSPTLSLYQTLLQLQYLEISHCAELKKIWKGPTPLVCLQNLKHIDVFECDKLGEIFSPTLSRTLLQLQDLRIKDCAELKEVVTGQENEATIAEIFFPKLQSIQLIDLRNLRYFCSGRFSFNFPALENLIVQDCDKMQTFTSGDVSTPKLNNIKLDSEDSFQTLWRGNVNDTIQHLFH